ncbi:NTF2-like N-terminal transpeptidase domain-containing protein, partial [Enterococcus faecalis]|uniref:NTF2-like N-terminal transpeptidase domain-containing protein n=1 Tax=Enterococcus faecalis TaxID=1351 RepID=UPI003D6A177E
VEKYQAIYSGIQAEGVKASDVQGKKGKDNQYTFTYKLSMSTPLGEMKDLSYESSIAKKGDSYQIAWKPSLIFPDMSGND